MEDAVEDMERRIVQLEIRSEQFASKEEIQALKTWWLSAVIAGTVVLLSVVVALLLACWRPSVTGWDRRPGISKSLTSRGEPLAELCASLPPGIFQRLDEVERNYRSPIGT